MVHGGGFGAINRYVFNLYSGYFVTNNHLCVKPETVVFVMFGGTTRAHPAQNLVWVKNWKVKFILPEIGNS